MIALLDHARRTVASRPLWLFLAFLLLLTVYRRLFRRGQGDGAGDDAFTRLAPGVALLYYVGLTVWYGLVPQQVDYAEPTMTCVAWLFQLGKPVYHAIDSAARYSHMYGPMAFAVPGAALWLFGPTMLVGKMVGVVAALIALAVMWLTIRTATRETRIAILACGICVLQFLMFRNLTFWSRPEPLQLAAVCIGLFAAARLPPIAAAIVLSVSMGLLWNLKFTGPLYSLPILAIFWTRTNLLAVALSALGAAILAAVPFFALPNVSLDSYLLWVRLSARNGLRVAALKENIEWALFLLVPILARLSKPTPLPESLRPVVPALLLGVVGVLIAASKPGAGAYHFVPFLPTIAYVYAASLPSRAEPARAKWLTPFLATLLFIVLIQQQYFFRLALNGNVAGSYADVADYLTTHPGERVGMGYSSAEAMTFARTLIVFETGDYLLDVPAIQEHQLSGMALPPATIDAMRACSVRTWLLPQGGEPFHIRNDYPQTGYAEIFPQAFIDAFHEAYVREEQTRYYDVWRCRARSR